jgi:hypothetical protein
MQVYNSIYIFLHVELIEINVGREVLVVKLLTLWAMHYVMCDCVHGPVSYSSQFCVTSLCLHLRVATLLL